MSKLVIVESPTKAKTIGKFLGNGYKVIASNGHVRDLPKSQLGVDVEHNFEPKYINIRGKGELIKELKTLAKRADKVYLATDPDREGEAISWHLAHLLDLNEQQNCRIEFHEITGTAVKDAIKQTNSLGKILKNVERSSLCAMQTPQGFRVANYKNALQTAELADFTDDCALMEQAGYPVYTVPGDYKNIKITTPEDLIIAEAFLKGNTKCE